MRTVFLLLVFLHGLIHVLGFVKGFGLRDVKELTLPISKPLGLIWLVASVLIWLFGVLYYVNAKYAWIFGLVAVVVSQLLVIAFWKDAKFGTILNIAVLVVSLVLLGNHRFQQMADEETKEIINATRISTDKVISERDMHDLPLPVQKWLRRSGALGKPYMNIGKVTQVAEMQMKPDQKNWLPATAIQYTSIDHPAFIWTVDVQMNPLIRFKGRDKFEDGRGDMLITLNGLLPVVDEQGEKMDEGSLQRYLGEMVWFPSLALSPYVSWTAIDSTTAEATMDYMGTTGSGTFFFNTEGDFVKFSAMRFKGNEADAKRYEWVLLVNGYKTFAGVKIPADMTATWKLEDQDWTWLKLQITDVTYNEQVISKPGTKVSGAESI
jgi:hypothetical protein